jgi:hypothetical protein
MSVNGKGRRRELDMILRRMRGVFTGQSIYS